MASVRQKASALKTVLNKDNPVPTSTPDGVMTLGDVLRTAREDRGQSLDMVADELMIRRFYLDALENNNFGDLPERVYATGFVRNYATYLGLDAPQLIEQFRREAYGARTGNYQVELVMPEPIVHSVVPGRSAIIAACGVLAVLAAGLFFAMRDKSPASASIPAPPVAAAAPSQAGVTTTPAPEIVAPPEAADITSSNKSTAQSTAFDSAQNNASVTATPEPAAPTATAPAAPVVQGIAIEATQSAWVEVKNIKGVILFTNILKAGQLLPLPEEAVTVTTGNAGGLRLVVDGQKMAALGQPEEVKRNMPVDPAQLRQR